MKNNYFLTMQMLAYQIEQLKEDVSSKETGLKLCESTLAKCNKKNEQLRAEIQSGLLKLSEAKAEITALRQEEARLNRIIQVCNRTRSRQEEYIQVKRILPF